MRRFIEIPIALAFWLIVFVVTMMGCAPTGTSDPMEHQGEALAIVWGTAFGQTDAPPTVNWVMGDHLDCTEPNGNRGFMALTVEGRKCKGGITFTGAEVFIAWPDGSNYSNTAFAHELAHAEQLRRNVSDPWHLEPGTWELVDAANELLINNGL